MNTHKIAYNRAFVVTFVIAASIGLSALTASVSAQQVYTQPTCNLSASQNTINSGESVTISWNSSNAVSAFLTPTPGGGVATNGSQVVSPTVTTTYTLAVHSSQGVVTNCYTTVQVNTTSNVPSCTISANPSNVVYSGNSSTLTWNSSNAASATLSNHGSVSTSGSRSVTPSGTTTYILTVQNSQGQSANCQTTVSVSTSSLAPSCWINISQYGSGYNYNQQSTLSWGSQNATSASISPNVGSVSTSGSRTVYQSGNQFYTMTVRNAQGQNATCQTSQYYPPTTNLSCNLSANPSTIQNGATSFLSWNSTGASSAWLSDGLGNVSPNGSLSVRPESPRNYTLTVSDNQGRTQTCNAYVTVSGGYPYISLNQIPYTGIDLGPLGSALYWAALAAFALAAGYLVVYYMPSRLNFVGVRTSRTNASVPTYVSPEGVGTPSIFTSDEEATMTRSVEKRDSAPESLPVFRAAGPSSQDSMTLRDSKDGDAPRITITRG